MRMELSQHTFWIEKIKQKEKHYLPKLNRKGKTKLPNLVFQFQKFECKVKMKFSKKSKVVNGVNLGKEWLLKSLLYQKISLENLQNLKDLLDLLVLDSKK